MYALNVNYIPIKVLKCINKHVYVNSKKKKMLAGASEVERLEFPESQSVPD